MRKVFEFYGWMMIIAAISMALYAMFASDVSALGNDNPESHRQVMLFLSVPMSIGMGVLFVMIGRGGPNASTILERKKEEKEEEKEEETMKDSIHEIEEKEEEKVSRVLPD